MAPPFDHHGRLASGLVVALDAFGIDLPLGEIYAGVGLGSAVP